MQVNAGDSVRGASTCMSSETKEPIQLLQGTLDLIYYAITKAGQKTFNEETKRWRTMAGLVERLLVEEA
jgi:hypothetical protein